MKSEEAAGIHVIRLALFGSLMTALARTWADPDLWGHVRFGADILAGGLPHSDPYSFTSDVAWINHEWLSEVLMDVAWSAAGGAGLIAVKMAAVLATLLFVVVTMHRDRVSPFTRDFLLFAAIVGMWSRVFVMRPQVFSIVLFAGLLWVLRAAERGRIRALWVAPVLFAIWVNFHGGWIVGLGILGVWTLVPLTPLATLTRSPAHHAHSAGNRSRGILAAAALLSVVATLANPYGVGLWTFLGNTVSPARPNISDWRPLLETGAAVVAPWIISAALATTAFVRAWRRIPLSHALIVVGLGIATIRVNRLDVFFVLSVVMLLGGHIDTGGNVAPPAPLWTARVKAALATLIVVASGVCWHERAQFSCVRLDGPWMPERESGAFIRENGLEGRLLAWFDWGQYAIWHFAPQLQVSIDGRRETVYSDTFVAQHVKLYFEPASSGEFLHRLAPDYAWIPVTLPLASALEREGWTRIFSGPASVVLARGPARATRTGSPEPHACFPGP